jgi:hypothetical protein
LQIDAQAGEDEAEDHEAADEAREHIAGIRLLRLNRAARREGGGRLGVAGGWGGGRELQSVNMLRRQRRGGRGADSRARVRARRAPRHSRESRGGDERRESDGRGVRLHFCTKEMWRAKPFFLKVCARRLYEILPLALLKTRCSLAPVRLLLKATLSGAALAARKRR